MHEEIICAGAGGQGVMLMGKLLAQAGLIERRNVSWMPSYGAEARGGSAYSMVIISDDEIASPIVTNPYTFFIMNRPSLERFASKIGRESLLIVNSSLVKTQDSFCFPLTDIANRLGNARLANMVGVGIYLAKTKVISFKSVIKALKIVLSDSKPRLLSLNIVAIKKGMELGKDG